MKRVLLSIAAAALGVMTVQAKAAESASATIDQLAASSNFSYALTVNDTGTTTIGTFWYAWTPGQDYMANSPLTVQVPAGWQDAITHGGPTDGYAIQWTAKTAASDIAAGSSLSGFGFTSAESPAALDGKSAAFPSTAEQTAVIYSATPFSDSGFTLVVPQVVAVPEPATLGLLGLAATALGLRRPRRASAAV